MLMHECDRVRPTIRMLIFDAIPQLLPQGPISLRGLREALECRKCIDLLPWRTFIKHCTHEAVDAWTGEGHDGPTPGNTYLSAPATTFSTWPGNGRGLLLFTQMSDEIGTIQKWQGIWEPLLVFSGVLNPTRRWNGENITLDVEYRKTGAGRGTKNSMSTLSDLHQSFGACKQLSEEAMVTAAGFNDKLRLAHIMTAKSCNEDGAPSTWQHFLASAAKQSEDGGELSVYHVRASVEAVAMR